MRKGDSTASERVRGPRSSRSTNEPYAGASVLGRAQHETWRLLLAGISEPSCCYQANSRLAACLRNGQPVQVVSISRRPDDVCGMYERDKYQKGPEDALKPFIFLPQEMASVGNVAMLRKQKASTETTQLMLGHGSLINVC